jgi:hypothetical protein
MYTIELKYFNPNTGNTRHLFFPALEVKLARDYLDDAMQCGCTILIWRLVPNEKIHVG